MDSKICTRCNIEKSIEDFYNKYTECKVCNSNRSLKHYHENKDKIPNQRKLYYEKNRDKLLQKQNNRYINYKELVKSYAELENKLKALQEKMKINDSENIKIFINEIYSKPHKKNYATNKTNVYYIDDIWSLDILDLKDYGPENKKGYRYVLVVIDNFSKFGWTTPLKNKNAQTIKDSFELILISSKRKPNLIESDRGREFYNNIFQDFLNKNDIKLYSRNSSYGAVFAERFNRTIRNLLKKIVFEHGDAKWIDILPTITKQYNNRIHSSTKLTPIHASLKKNEGYVYKNLLDKRKKITPKFQINNLVRTADLKKTFSKGDMTNWSYKLYKITKIINDTLPSYKIDNLPERYSESLLKKTNLTMKENDNVMKKSNLI